MLRLLTFFAVLAFVFGQAWADQGGQTSPPDNPNILVSISPIKGGATWESVSGDRLELLQGWTLKSKEDTFGGLSALELFEGTLVSVSDQGHFLDFGPLSDWRNQSGKQVDLGWYEIPIDKSALKNRGAATDAEALAISDRGELLVAFEREHRIQVHTDFQSTPRTWEVPIALRRPAPLGFGIEAMTRLRDGRMFAVSEKVKRDGGFRAYLTVGRQGQNRDLMVYIPEEDWMPSAATTLPSGDVLLIERRASAQLLGFRSRFVLLRERELKPAARLKPKVLFTFGFASVGADNLEGLIAIPYEDALELWVVADDNFKPFQRTRLLRFRLDLHQEKAPPSVDIGIKPKEKPKLSP